MMEQICDERQGRGKEEERKRKRKGRGKEEERKRKGKEVKATYVYNTCYICLSVYLWFGLSPISALVPV